LLPFFLIWIGNNQLHDAKIPKQKSLVKDQEIKILAFFSQPDDGLTVSGTMMLLLGQGNEVFLVILTKGEAEIQMNNTVNLNCSDFEPKKCYVLPKSLESPY
jgi:hypothetical protein